MALSLWELPFPFLPNLIIINPALILFCSWCSSSHLPTSPPLSQFLVIHCSLLYVLGLVGYVLYPSFILYYFFVQIVNCLLKTLISAMEHVPLLWPSTLQNPSKPTPLDYAQLLPSYSSSHDQIFHALPATLTSTTGHVTLHFHSPPPLNSPNIPVQDSTHLPLFNGSLFSSSLSLETPQPLALLSAPPCPCSLVICSL